MKKAKVRRLPATSVMGHASGVEKILRSMQ